MGIIIANRADAMLRTLDIKRRAETHRRGLPLLDVATRDATATGDGSYTITGHAATTSSEYTLMENDFMRVRERISATAFDRVLASNPFVHLNVGHDNNKAIAVTGRTGMGGLELSMDDVGLRFFARVDPADPDVIGLRSKMSLGIINQASFAFTIADETRTESDNGDLVDVLYDIREVGKLYDVCVCAQGANPQTDSSLRDASLKNLVTTLGRDSFDLSGLDHRSTLEGDQESIIATQVSGGGVSSRVLTVQAQARARSLRGNYPTTKD